MNLLSIEQAARDGIKYLRKQQWRSSCDYLKISILEGGIPGPWVYLYSPSNTVFNGTDPVPISAIEFDFKAVEFLKHEGPLMGSEEYQQMKAVFDKVDANVRAARTERT